MLTEIVQWLPYSLWVLAAVVFRIYYRQIGNILTEIRLNSSGEPSLLMSLKSDCKQTPSKQLAQISYPTLKLPQLIANTNTIALVGQIMSRFRQDNRKGLMKMSISGPPGTGKTMLARVLAGELAVPLIQPRQDQSTSIFEAFKTAREKAPSIILIQYSKNISTQLKLEMDNEERRQILIIVENGSLNFNLDLDIPNEEQVRRYITQKLAGLGNSSAIDVENLVEHTSGSSLAKIETIIDMTLMQCSMSSKWQGAICQQVLSQKDQQLCPKDSEHQEPRDSSIIKVQKSEENQP